MPLDYKEAIQQFADEMAADEWGAEFYDLPTAKQDEIYNRATVMYADKMADYADYLRDKAKYE